MAGRPPRLTAAAVRRIRRWAEARQQSGKRVSPPAKRLAGTYGVDVSVLYQIANRQTYRWVQ